MIDGEFVACSYFGSCGRVATDPVSILGGSNALIFRQEIVTQAVTMTDALHSQSRINFLYRGMVLK